MAPPLKRIFIFDMMRHRSLLFFRFLCTCPDLYPVFHPYLAASIFGPERVTKSTSRSAAAQDDPAMQDRPEYMDFTYARGARDYLQEAEQAAKLGKVSVANEHTQFLFRTDISLPIVRTPSSVPAATNPTMLPDDVFDSVTPVILIRNPIFSVPSNYISIAETMKVEPGSEDWKLITGMALQRHLFDVLRARDGRPPIVVDGDDVIWRTQELSQSLYKVLDLTPGTLSDIWEAVPEEKRSKEPLVRHWMQVIDNSTGILHPSESRPGTGLDETHGKWVERFGKDLADKLRTTVEDNTPHYEYLKQFAI